MKRVAGALVALVAVACTGGDDPADATPPTAPAGTAAEPAPGPGSPFCAGVAEITAALDGDSPPADVTAFLAEAYGNLIAVAPAVLVPDLEALVASLGEDPVAATTGAGTTATVPSDDLAPPVLVVTPGERVADYVADECGRIGANPGPPATPPSGGYDTVADTTPPTSVD